MSDHEHLRLVHAYREDALGDAEAVRLGQALADDAAARRALALDGQIALAIADDQAADQALLATLRAHWPVHGDPAPPPTGATGRVHARYWLAAAGIAAVAALIAILWSHTAATAGTEGAVLIAAPLTIGGDHPTIRRDGAAAALTAAHPLRRGDRLSLPAGATVAVSARHEATVIHLGGPAELTLRGDLPGKHLVLHRGQLSATVAPQPPGHPLLISCPFSEVTVVGTTFSIAAAEDGDRIEVRHGTVWVAAPDGGAGVVVTAGGSAEAGPGRAPALHPPAPGTTPVAPPLAVPPPAAWFDFAAVDGDSVADRLGGSPGTLIGALVGGDGEGGRALRLDGGNSRLVFPVPASDELTLAVRLRRERQAGLKENPALLGLPNLVLYTNPGQETPTPTDDSLHLMTRSGPPISGWSTNGRMVRYGEWQLLVLTLRGASHGNTVPELWIDGKRQQLWPWKGDWPQRRPDPRSGTLGIEPDVHHSITGLARDLRLWPRVLGPGEIAELAAGR